MMMSSTTTLRLSIVALAAILAAGFAVAAVATAPSAYAQGAPPASSDSSGKKTLDVTIEPQWSDGGNAKFKVSFFNPGTTTLHQHQDYNVVILQNGNEIYNAAKALNQQVLHNVEGTVTIPYQFKDNGPYTVRATLFATNIPPIPITPENTDLSITVAPEFPLSILGAVAAVVMAGAIVVTRLKLAPRTSIF
ncbi:MAG TPA: hypothetical protein VHA09_04265 [Nitrososphaera sp.]|nr:hypothetical protein [Nitrososphaera sp.]